VFQVKFHDTLAGSRNLLDVLKQDLETELHKITHRHNLRCDSYVFLTNVPLTGVRQYGSRDQLEAVAEPWRKRIDDIQIWDAADVSRMLDATPTIRQTYLDDVLPGDVLAALLRHVDRSSARVQNILRTYLSYLLDPRGSTGAARASEAGDETDLRLSDLYIDLKVAPKAEPEIARRTIHGVLGVVRSGIRPPRTTGASRKGTAHSAEARGPEYLPASLAFLTDSRTSMIEAGPGYGKSTLCQFLVLFHAARLNPHTPGTHMDHLARRLDLEEPATAQALDSTCIPRLPFRIELRSYARWLTDTQRRGMAAFICDLINRVASANLSEEDLFDVCQRNPILLILDGLDEVPNRDARTLILEDASAFVRRCRDGEGADLQLVLSSRPQGYYGEFQQFEPTTWTILDLPRRDFDSYCSAWLNLRVTDPYLRTEADDRLRRAMVSPEVQRLAGTLLQATVMLHIVARRHEIPHERTALFKKYVEVVFEREKAKTELVKTYEQELHRLHELVAYRIHRHMESGAPDAVSLETLRQLALSTWEMYRGNEVPDTPLTHIVNGIIEAARDRLVLLKGQGPHQDDIGFLLASYREYFAAEYLRSHERADPDRVFTALLARDSHWENVLRFYAGLQDPRTQAPWITYVPDEGSAIEDQEGSLLREIRFKRLLLKLLPEFTRVSHSSLMAALKRALDKTTLFGFESQDWAADLVGRAHNGTFRAHAVRILLDALGGPLSQHTAALTLAARLLPSNSSLRAEYVARVQASAGAEPYRRAFVGAVLSGDVEPNLAQTCLSGLGVTGEDVLATITFEPRGRETAKTLPTHTVVEAALTSWQAAYTLRSHPILEDRFGEVFRYSRSSTVNARMSVRCELWPRLRGSVRLVSKLSDAIETLPDACRKYVEAAVRALGRPADPVADEQVDQLERQSPDLNRLRVLRRMLGPLRSDFAEPDEYETFIAARVACLARPRYVTVTLTPKESASSPTGFSENWLLGCVRPAMWDILRRSGVVETGRDSALLAALLGGSPRVPVPVFWEIGRMHAGPEPGFRLGPLLPVLHELFEADPDGGFLDGANPVRLGVSSDRSGMSSDHLQELVDLISGGRTPGHWLAYFLWLGLGVVADASAWSLAAWRRATAKQRREAFRVRYMFDLPEGSKREVLRSVKQLIAADTQDAAELAIVFLLHSGSEVRIESSRISAVCTKLLREKELSDDGLGGVLRLLASGPVSAEEDALWTDPALWHCRWADRFTPAIASRLLSITGAVSGPSKANPDLWRLIAARDSVPSRVVAAALTRLISAQAGSRSEIVDAAWQVSTSHAE
jgi:hypothetical protein